MQQIYVAEELGYKSPFLTACLGLNQSGEY